MQFLLLLLLVLHTAFTPGPPNFYPTLLTAMDVARAGNKEMVIFFDTKSCLDCIPAWKAFEKDAKATGQYVSTKMDAEDFDGKIVFEKYGLRQVPAWVIVAPGDHISDSWTGGWKDASGKPILYAVSATAPIEKEITRTPAACKEATTSPATMTSPAAKTDTKGMATTEQKPVSTLQPNETSVTSIAEGFVLQAGYFGSAANAEKLIADLKAKNLSEFTVKSLLQNGSTFHRVISKIYSTESEALSALSQLATAGFKATLKKTQEIQ